MVRYFASLLYSLANLLQQVLRVLYAATTVYVEDKMIQTSPSLRRSQKYSHLSIVYTLKYCPWLLKILLMSTRSMFLQKILSALDSAVEKDSRVFAVRSMSGEALHGLRTTAIALGGQIPCYQMPSSQNWLHVHIFPLWMTSRMIFPSGTLSTTMGPLFWSSSRKLTTSGRKTTPKNSKPRKICESDAVLKIKSSERRSDVSKNGQKLRSEMLPKHHRLTPFPIQQLLSRVLG